MDIPIWKILLHYVVLSYTTLGSLAIRAIEYETRAKLLLKQAGGADRTICTDTELFDELLKRSHLIMDKSGMIKRYVIDHKLLLVTAPPKWGKTINVDMLRFFLQSETFSRNLPRDKAVTQHQFVDRGKSVSFEFFKRGSIYDKFWRTLHKFEQPPTMAATNDILHKYCGKFPVIYVNFTLANWTGNDYQSMINDFKIILADTFGKHEYAMKKLERTLAGKALTPNQQKVIRRNVGTLQRFITGEENSPVEMQCSLQFLSITLRNHYLKYVHVLIDGYDLVYRKYFLENGCDYSEAVKIENFFKIFFKETFVSNPFLEKGFVTGMLPLKIAEDFKNVNEPLHQYYGFTKNEISRLFYFLNITYDLGQEARKWYGGYRTCARLEPTLYNPWSIAHFSNTKVIRNYLENATDTSFFKRMLKNHNTSSLFEQLLYDRKVLVINEKFQYDVDIMYKLKSLIDGEPLESWDKHYRYVLQYMRALGFLTIDLDYDSFKALKPLASVPLKIPNLEVYHHLSTLVLNAYTDGWKETSRDLLHQVSTGLIQALDSLEEQVNASSLETSLSELFQSMVNTELDANATFETTLLEDPYIVHRAIFLIAFNVKNSTKWEIDGKTRFSRTVIGYKFRPDVRFYKGDRGGILEVTNGANSTARCENATLHYYDRYFKKSLIPIKTIRVIELVIYPNTTITSVTKLLHRNITQSV